MQALPNLSSIDKGHQAEHSGIEFSRQRFDSGVELLLQAWLWVSIATGGSH